MAGMRLLLEGSHHFPGDLAAHGGATLVKFPDGFQEAGRSRFLQNITACAGTQGLKDLLILFVDDFQEVVYEPQGTGGRVNSVSGNFSDIPVILITAHDQNAGNIVTHELIHGLGKPIHNLRSHAFDNSSATVDNTWSEGPCQTDMGNPKRQGGPKGPFSNPSTDLMDWASYRAMDAVKNIK